MKLIKIIPVILLLLSAPVYSQTQELTLEKAVNGGSEMNPQTMKSLSFSPDEEFVVFWDNNEFVKIKVATKNKPKGHSLLFTLDELNDHLKKGNYQELKKAPAIEILTSTLVEFKNDNKVFIYNFYDRKLDLKFSIPEDAEHTDFFRKLKLTVNSNDNELFYAFTKGNDLFYADKKGEHRITNNEGTEIVSGQSIARHEFGIVKGTFWSPHGGKLAFYEKDESEVTEYALSDISTKPATTVLIKYPMAGQKSEKSRVGIYDLKADTIIYLKTIGESDDYLTNLTWGPDKKTIYITELNRDQNHLKLNVYSAESGELIKTLFEEKDEKYIQPEHKLYFIPGSDDEFLWYSERDNFNHLYHYHTNGELLSQTTKGEWLVDEFIGFDKKGKYAFVTGWDANSIDRNIYKIDLKVGSKTKLNTEAGVHSAILSESGKYLIDIYSNIDTPKKYQVLSASGTAGYTLFESTNPLADYKISKPETGTLNAEDGTLLFYRMIKPTDFDETKKYPVLVYVYSGPNVQLVNNKWNAGASLWMYYMAEQGYIVFTIDGRGSGNRGLEFEQKVFRQLGQLEMLDQLTGVEFLKKQAWVDADRMAIHGWSYGGYMTLSMMVNYPEVYKVGVAGGPVTDWALYEVMYGERYMDTPDSNPEGYDKTRLYDKTKNIKGKVLVINGAIDRTVVPQHSELFLKDCVDNNIQVDFFTYPGYEHNVRGKDRVHLMRKVLDYVMDNME